MQLRLRACLKSDVELAAMTHNLLHHLAHLVHLDGIDHKILALVVILLGSLLKAARNLLNAIIENIGETQQYR